ncbi:hypothetical protein ONZ45_g13881 [Pleurotus djamor]|nr:hypothetical protein ONZ45_g13881 [Pleurotus djamor]
MAPILSASPAFTPALEFPDQRVADIEHLIAKELARLIPRNLSNQRNAARKQFVVLLTGSTGSLGTYLLRDLINDTRVHHVYTHNRPSTSSLFDRHASSFRELGLDESILASDKLTSLEGHLIEENLGLESSLYEQLLSEVNVIIHNAWMLDLNGSVLTFEPLISGSMNLINFAQQLQAPIFNFVFSSSNAAVQNFGGEGLVPEEVILDARASLGIGYGESKYVVERANFQHISGQWNGSRWNALPELHLTLLYIRGSYLKLQISAIQDPYHI